MKEEVTSSISQHLKIEKPEFKDGDIIYSEDARVIAIFERVNYDGFDVYATCHDGLITSYGTFIMNIDFRLANDSEKKQLFDAFKSINIRWDSETKKFKSLNERHIDPSHFIARKMNVSK